MSVSEPLTRTVLVTCCAHTEQLKERLQDPEDKVRKECIACVCSAAEVNPVAASRALLEAVGARTLDKKVRLPPAAPGERIRSGSVAAAGRGSLTRCTVRALPRARCARRLCTDCARCLRW